MQFRADWAGKIKMFTQSVAACSVMVDLSLTGRVPWVHMTRDIAIWVTLVVTILSSITYIFRAWKIFGVEGEAKPRGGQTHGA